MSSKDGKANAGEMILFFSIIITLGTMLTLYGTGIVTNFYASLGIGMLLWVFVSASLVAIARIFSRKSKKAENQ